MTVEVCVVITKQQSEHIVGQRVDWNPAEGWIRLNNPMIMRVVGTSAVFSPFNVIEDDLIVSFRDQIGIGKLTKALTEHYFRCLHAKELKFSEIKNE